MTREEAIKEINKVFEPAFANYIIIALIEGATPFDKALEQQPCEDLINQRATTCRHGGHCEWVVCDKCNHYEPDALSQQPCEDAVSRHDALNCVTFNEFRYRIVEDIKALPSVTPKEKTGKWIRTTDKLGHLVWECDKCGWQQRFATNFCPDCGCHMVETQESEDKE